MLAYALDAFRAASVEEIVVVAAPGEVEAFRLVIARGCSEKTEKVIAGGATRQESVAAGLRELAAGTEYVLIHDAARPLVEVTLIERCIAAARLYGAAIAALPVSDTLKAAVGETVAETVDRSGLWAAQTPQAFRLDLISAAYEEAQRRGIEGTDDASLVEAAGHPVRLVMGSPRNLKITYPEDLAMAEALVRGQGGEQQVRCGVGYDVHRLAPGRRLVLGGVEFPGAVGLLGHSDADVVTHAICDALLGACGLGDIGAHFPDNDPRYAGADSVELLRQAAQRARAAGFRVLNVDAVVVAEEPRIADQVPRMRERLGAALGIAASAVNIKGKTEEGLGFTGARQGIASHAVCVVAAETRQDSASQERG